MIDYLFDELKHNIPYFQNSHVYDQNGQAWETLETNIRGLKPSVQNVNMLKVISFCRSSNVVCADATLFGEYSKGDMSSFEWWIIDKVVILDFFENGKVELLIYKGKEVVKNTDYFI